MKKFVWIGICVAVMLTSMSCAFPVVPVNCRWLPEAFSCQTRTNFGWHLHPSVPRLRPIQYTVVKGTGGDVGDGGGDAEANPKEKIKKLESEITQLNNSIASLMAKNNGNPSDRDEQRIVAKEQQIVAKEQQIAAIELQIAEFLKKENAKPAAEQTNLFQWIESFEGFGEYQYEPSRLAETTFQKRLGREESFQIAYNLLEHQCIFPAKRNSLKAVAGAPGCGKSYFLDEFGSFFNADVSKFCRNGTLEEAFKSALSISITYNGASRVLHNIEDDFSGLKARLLWTYTKGLHGRNFDSFFQEFKRTDQSERTVVECLSFVASHFFPNVSSEEPKRTKEKLIFFGVDEISKSTNETRILTEIGFLGDLSLSLKDGSTAKVLPIVTSLTKSTLNRVQTASGRGIDLIPLPTCLSGAARQLASELGLPNSADSVVEMLCREVGNHGRMLECLRDLLSGTERDAFNRNPSAAVPNIVAGIRRNSRTEVYFGYILEHPLELLNAVGAAILGKNVTISDTPLHCLKTYAELQSEGVFLGDNTTDRRFMVPVMSPLQITVWAEAVRGLGSKRPPHCKDLTDALLLMFSARTQYKWEDFEEFHLCHEFVRRYFIGDVSIREFYSLDQYSDSQALSDRPSKALNLVMNNKNVQLVQRAQEEWNWNKSSIHPFAVHGITDTSVQLAAIQQQAFDIATFQKICDNSEKSTMIFTQCRWSDDADQKDSKRLFWLRQISGIPVTGRLEHLYVYVAARQVPRLQDRTYHIERAIILGWSDLMRFYGPTVAGAHRFQLQLSHQELQTNAALRSKSTGKTRQGKMAKAPATAGRKDEILKEVQNMVQSLKDKKEMVETLNVWKKDDIKERLRGIGAKTTGKKADLIELLLQVLDII